ncbi:hypothetical protein LBMAG42_32350 [Deltaproteobacteria bacterium]|nr:hypothetical protein LBMAG42_32350 [Deltaproteobacteria bacterium]
MPPSARWHTSGVTSEPLLSLAPNDDLYRQIPVGDVAAADPGEGGVFSALASPWIRWAARVLDAISMAAVALFGGFVGGVVAPGPPDQEITAGTLVGAGLCAIPMFIAQCWLLAQYGQSLGKKLLGIRIVNAAGETPSWVKTILVREGARYGMGFIPVVGSLLSLVDTLCIFRGTRRTLHDDAAGTYVVVGFSDFGRAAPGLVPAANAGGLSVFVAVVCGVGMVALLGISAAVAIPNFVAMQLKAKRSEVPANVDAIRTAEHAYHASYGTYLPVGGADLADTEISGKTQHDWIGGGAWRELGWAPDGKVRGGYWVEAGENGFIVHGVCDVDADGEYAYYTATQDSRAELRSPPDVY